jgi:hypothetical protein
MSYISQPSITLADGPNTDAFQRLRISMPYTVFDSKQLVDTGSYVWATKTISNASASFVPNNSSVRLVASASNSTVIRQTKRRFPYQPGKSQLIICTGNFEGTSTNVIKRIGYFDGNDGLYFQLSGSSFGVGLRSNTSGTPVDTFISQSSWNLDAYNGSGGSGKTVDLTKSQIFFIDFEWLGVGRVRYGIFQGGVPTYVHEITNVNALSTVYMTTPNLPIRYEIINSGSTPSALTHICSTVASEGGLDQNGGVRALSNPANTGINAGVYCGLLAVRLKANSLGGSIIPLGVNTVQTTTNCVYESSVLINPTTSSAWLWQDLPNSIIQYATASTSANAITNEGTKIFSTMTAANNPNNQINNDPTIALGADVDGNRDTLVIGWNGIQGNAGNACLSFIWRELI